MADQRGTDHTEGMSEIFKKKAPSLAQVERNLQKIENKLFEEASSVLLAATHHVWDLDLESKELPAEWLQELQECEDQADYDAKLRELERRRRIAHGAMMSAKEAPVALALAGKVWTGMTKARAMAGAAPKSLNLTMVSISAPNQPIPQFPEKEIEHE